MTNMNKNNTDEQLNIKPHYPRTPLLYIFWVTLATECVLVLASRARALAIQGKLA